MSVVLTSSPALDQAVVKFKTTFGGNPDIITNGQFQVAGAVRQALRKLVQDELNSAGEDPAVTAALDVYWANRSPVTAAKVAAVIRKNKLEGKYPNILKAFSPDPSATSFWAKKAYDEYWHNNGIPSPLVITNPSAAKRQAAYDQEASACYDTSAWFARKWINATGAPTKPGGKVANGLIGQAQLKGIGGGRQVIVYARSALSDDIDRIDNALAAGVRVLLGVLSGDNHTNVGRKFPSPEHYLLLLAGDGLGKFVFWDSDALTSNIHSMTWGPGFGLLHYDRTHATGLFSTAVNHADLMNVTDNYHNDEAKRHCYQAYYAVPISG